MDRKQFIDWLIVKYMSNAEQRQAEVAYKDFESILPEDIDFDYLKASVLKNYDKRIIPDYNFLKQYFRKKTSSNLNTQWTKDTWNIYGKAKDGNIYTIGNYMGVTEYQGREMFKKGYPKLEYIGNNREEVVARIG